MHCYVMRLPTTQLQIMGQHNLYLLPRFAKSFLALSVKVWLWVPYARETIPSQVSKGSLGEKEGKAKLK